MVWRFMLSSLFLSRGMGWLTSENGLAFTFGKWTNTMKRRTFPYENMEEATVIKRGIQGVGEQWGREFS